MSEDIQAEVVAAAIGRCADMELVDGKYVIFTDIEPLLLRVPPAAACALVLIGPEGSTAATAGRWLAQRQRLVVMRVEVAEHSVQIAARQVGIDSLLEALRTLVARDSAADGERTSRFRLAESAPAGAVVGAAAAAGQPLQDATTQWLHATFRAAVERTSRAQSDHLGLSGAAFTVATVTTLLDARPARTGHESCRDTEAADKALARALEECVAGVEPLSALFVRLGMTPLEFRLLALALAPELDPRYQSCVGLLMDDMGRRVGTLGLYTELLGEPSLVRNELAESGALSRWHLLDTPSYGLPAADEPLRVERVLREWLLGQADALVADPLVARVTRRSRWGGAELLDDHRTRADAIQLIGRLRADPARWQILAGSEGATWRGMLELGAQACGTSLIRVDASRLAGVAAQEVDECARRLARLARLESRPLILDAGGAAEDATTEEDPALALAAIGGMGVPAALIAEDNAMIVRLLADAACDVVEQPATVERADSVRRAAEAVDAFLTPEAAARAASRYPLRIDGLASALQLARTLPLPRDAADAGAQRFETACREVSNSGLSRLADRLEPSFDLDDVVLPDDRREQLLEIVDNVLLASQVLDTWKFRRQLPYGRGVAALFHGPSGTGKTMAALAVAHRLGVQVLRIDLSRIVSKYIGDTEKNIDRVFSDARSSGAALLVDEADALLGKRSEVKDAHDRYANIEVAYLLQRMEAHEGLVILTTNLRQNLDSAFVRRLRFIVDFPRPDAQARERIWRRCLPDEAHALDDAAFRQLGRRMDLTGGHIRQITLRAAFLAAAAKVPIGLAHISAAARAEFAKLGMPPVEIELAERRRAA